MASVGARRRGRSRDHEAPIRGNVGLQFVIGGLNSPLFLTAPSGDPSRLFIVERGGKIRIVKNGALRSRPFLDISSQVSTANGGGLYSMAFHPGYATNGRFFIYFTNLDGDIELRRYRVSGSNANRANLGTARTILTVPEPAGNHHGGLAAFGPDGYLYVAIGDDGSAQLQVDNAQDLTTLLGKIVRIDVNVGRYSIPPDNPFLDEPGARNEIWALGVRNPWRYSFDDVTGNLYMADIGQELWEEVNETPADEGGRNYGWPIMEGSSCFNPPSGCDTAGLAPPIFEYDHSQGCSITGGYVYRGRGMPSFDGVYFYSDFCSGWLRSFLIVNGMPADHRDWGIGDIGGVFSFGEDAAGELYILTTYGEVHRLVETG